MKRSEIDALVRELERAKVEHGVGFVVGLCPNCCQVHIQLVMDDGASDRLLMDTNWTPEQAAALAADMAVTADEAVAHRNAEAAVGIGPTEGTA